MYVDGHFLRKHDCNFVALNSRCIAVEGQCIIVVLVLPLLLKLLYLECPATASAVLDC
jgi:hypothetical protein